MRQCVATIMLFRACLKSRIGATDLVLLERPLVHNPLVVVDVAGEHAR